MLNALPFIKADIAVHEEEVIEVVPFLGPAPWLTYPACPLFLSFLLLSCTRLLTFPDLGWTVKFCVLLKKEELVLAHINRFVSTFSCRTSA